MMDVVNRTVSEEEAGLRLDRFLAAVCPEFSRSYLKTLLQEGHVLRNGRVEKPSAKVKAGDEILLEIPAPKQLEVKAENIPLDIVYEDGDLLVVNKPQGMVVHPAAGNESGTLVNALLNHCQDLSSINGVQRPGIVHRIDKNTSGLLVVCKNDRTHRELAEQFAVHSITRVYTAICYHHFQESDITVDQPIARDRKDRKKMAVDISGKRAVTHIHREENLKHDFCLVTCRLETGRTHQIRVHMAYIRHPILGDPVYGPKKCPYHLAGQVLHAGTLGFVHPSTGKYMEFHADLPAYFQKLLQTLSESDPMGS